MSRNITLGKECVECEGIVDKLYGDPRDPPIESDPCLCRNCRINMLEEALEGLHDQVRTITEDIADMARES